MARKQLNLITALKDGAITHVKDVDSGLKCGCVCPACGEPLVARKGTKIMHHFAHHAGRNCEYGYESSLHLAAKEILAKAKKMTLPAVYVEFPESYKSKELVCEAKEIEIERVALEKRYNDVIPDVVVYAGGEQIFVEVYVTHSIDDVKLKKLQQANISTIEIDLSKKDSITSVQELTELLLLDNEKKIWKYNAVANKYLQSFYQFADKRKIVSRGFALQVDGCPIQSRIWKGKPYANFIDDCLYCDYCISSAYEGELLCSGSRRVATIKDLETPEEQRVQDSSSELAEQREMAFAAGRCPYCGGKVVERNGRYGSFWGCSNYPHCRFTASADPETGELRMKG